MRSTAVSRQKGAKVKPSPRASGGADFFTISLIISVHFSECRFARRYNFETRPRPAAALLGTQLTNARLEGFAKLSQRTQQKSKNWKSYRTMMQAHSSLQDDKGAPCIRSKR